MPTEPSVMSFAVSLANRTQEWGSNGLDGLFATRTNAINPKFYTMITDMVKFNQYVLIDIHNIIIVYTLYLSPY